jgi:hypothetical protein
MEAEFAYDVFLSHNKKDKPRVRRLAKRLKKAGLRVWFDAWIIEPGDDIYLAIERGLESSGTLVLCLSPPAVNATATNSRSAAQRGVHMGCRKPIRNRFRRGRDLSTVEVDC